jgi:mycothiol synthase
VTLLPAGYAVRPATLDAADLEAVLALWIDVDVAAVGFPDSTADDVRDALSDPRVALAADSRLVLAADGRLVAYARVLDSNESDRFEGDLYVHPELATGLEADAVAQFLLAELERRAAEKAAGRGFPTAEISFWAVTSEYRLAGWLQQAGYANVRRWTRMEVSLSGTEHPPVLPAGVRISVADESEEGRRTVHRLLFASFADHFGTPYEPYDAWSSRMHARSSADPGHWWLLDIDDEPVGLVLGDEQFAEEKGGWVQYLGVLPEFRGRGLGRALLEHALASFAARGREKVGLGVDTRNETGALALYESVGMRPVFQVDFWQRRIPKA